MVDEIFLHWNVLHISLTRYEQLIRTRWMKRTKSQRREILIKVWPDMALEHQPDLNTPEPDLGHRPGENMPDYSSELGDRLHAARAWPYINVEDLLRPKALLIFLNSRGRHHPNKFAISDLELAPMFKLRAEFLACRKDLFTIGFIGRKSGQDYGEFLEWENEASMQESLRSGRTVHVEHGLQILIIQHGILLFLTRCVNHILKDIVDLSLILKVIMEKDTEEAPPVLPEPPQLTDNEGPYSRLDIIAREAPYHLPFRLDLARLQTLASAQRNQAIDHVWALREDPSSFVDTVEDFRSHRSELILDSSGRLHPHAQDFPLYNKALRQMIIDDHCKVFIWHEIHQRITQLRDLSSRHAKHIRVNKDLPLDLFEALKKTRFLLENISLDFITIIKAEFPASPPLRAFHYRANPDDLNLRKFFVKPIEKIDENDKSLMQLLRLISLFQDKGFRSFCTLHSILDEFGRLMQDDARAKSLISPRMASSISQLCIISECLHQLHQFQPWAHKIEAEIEAHRFRYLNRYHELFETWGKLNNANSTFLVSRLCKLGSPRDGKFDYPAHERRTRATVERMRAAEAALGAFWKASDAHWHRHVGTTPLALVQHIVGERSVHSTPMWVEPSKPSSEVVDSSSGSDSSTCASFTEYSHDASKQITGVFSRLSISSKSKKTKTKIRGVAVPQEEPALNQQDVSAMRLTPTFSVDKRVLKVFRSLFHCPNSHDQPGEVAWTDFLHAMVSTDFTAEKLQGSAWHFKPKYADVERSIQFHEPHPGNKLPFTWARRYGRRLARAFGWSGDSFTLI